MNTTYPASAMAKFTQKTAYPRKELETRIVHIGFGAFHRGHQAVYNDLTNQLTGDYWGIFEINLFGGNALTDALAQQEHLFSVIEKSAQTTTSRLVRTLTGAIHTPKDGIQAAIEKLVEPQVKIISLTITEKGYCSDPRSRKLDLANPLIAHDLKKPRAPQSAIGLIVEGLRLRREQGLNPLSVLSCDNIPENGALTKTAILDFAAQLDGDLAQWIEQNITFPNTMVDRIVPAMTPEQFTAIEKEIGYADPCGVVCEAFRQWIIEDNFAAGRPAWDKAEAMFVADVLPYEEMKLRMLNGSHSFLAYNGGLAGYEFIYQCMEDAVFRKAAHHLMLQEQAKSLSPHLAVDVNQYAALLIERFSNPNIKHKTGQIAMDGSQKLPQRAIDPYLTLQQRGIKGRALATLIAGWLHYVIQEITHGRDVADPLNNEFKAVIKADAPRWQQALSLLNIQSIFGNLAADNSDFIHEVQDAFTSIETHGITSTVEKLIK